ncbi:hypothetical protein [Microbacterium arborescens]|uniref:hypothetical protein n=1 Tax=Microbacterium arborescens TaxID=33883 RepID=UPI0025A0B31A|nr:hypothetical protein [Microbacterium arborescens]WJM16384.1 hypothetical protein QUC20_03435 [Microbacterium arborescens]
MPAVSTSQRTYRYLRLTLAGAPIAIMLAVLFAIPDAGVLPSVSHYFYSSARTVFSAALVTAAACLLALSGRGPQRVLLDVAALLAPLIAIIPTPVSPGEVPGVVVDCAAAPCVPVGFTDDLDNAVATYLAIGAAVLAIGLVLARRGDIALRDTGPTLALAAAVLAATTLVWTLAPDQLVRYGHAVAAFGFFILIALVALAEALRPSDTHPPARRTRIGYIVVAVALLLDLAATAVSAMLFDLPVVLAGELVALALFLVFWMMQTAQKWSLADPALRA